MKKNGKRFLKMCAALLLIFLIMLGAHTQTSSGASQSPALKTWLDKKLELGGLAAVYFAAKTADPKTMLFDAANKDRRFTQAGVHFLRVNAAKPENAPLLKDFDLKTLPAIMLFKDGDAVMQGDDLAVLTNFATAADIRKFINKNLGADIDEEIQLNLQNAEIEEPETSTTVYKYYRKRRPSVGVSFGFGAPTYDYWYGNPDGYYGYYRPYWGDGWTRGYSGYGYGWRNGGYWGRPGGNVGFGIGFGI